MRCQSCKGSISLTNFIRDKKCPACGAELKRMPTKEQLRETLISFAEDKGYIFWAIVYLFAVYILGFFEQIFGKGILFDYVLNYKFRTLVLAAYSGSIIDYFAKANVEVTAVRNKFIFRPPYYLRVYRRYTNFFLFVGFALSAFAMIRWPGYIHPLPATTLITSFCLCLHWAIMGFVLTEDDMNDKRIRYFMEEMRVRRPKYYYRASAIYIGGMFVAGVAYWKLVHISGLWWYITNIRLVYNVVSFFRQYFGWVHKFVN